MAVSPAILILLSLAAVPCIPPAWAACPFHSAPGSTLTPPLGRHCRALQQSSSGATTAAYRERVKTLDLNALKADIAQVLRTPQAFWPPDFGSYAGLLVRYAWHCAGSFRASDGRGGCEGARIHFGPELSWPDNANLDKARALLEPVKAKYADGVSWSDLIVVAGNVALEEAGAPPLGLCLGRIDDVDGSASLALGPTSEQAQVAPCAQDGNCSAPMGPTTMGLIYVNPEGPMGQPLPEKSAPQIRDTFDRMGMDDVETISLIGGGHALGKAHGKGNNTYTSGFEGHWSSTPTLWTNEYFRNLLSFHWAVHRGPGGKHQWRPSAAVAPSLSGKQSAILPDLMMLTADVALLNDPQYLKLVQLYAQNDTSFREHFAQAWYKLMTRDMGPHSRCIDVGNTLPPSQPWQCPLPATPQGASPDYAKVAEDIADVMAQPSEVLPPDMDASGQPTYAALFATLARQSATTFRETDHMGGTNGARIRFAPMKDWDENRELDAALAVLQPVKDKHPDLSYADLIVLAGHVAQRDSLPMTFRGGRTDAAEACSFNKYLKPLVYQSQAVGIKDDAQVRGLSVKEYVALLGAPRSPSQQQRMGYSGAWSEHVLPLGNDFFRPLLGETWENTTAPSGKTQFKAQGKSAYITPADHAVATDPELRRIAVEFAGDRDAFLHQYSIAWSKVMSAGLEASTESAAKAGVKGTAHAHWWGVLGAAVWGVLVSVVLMLA